MRNRYYAGLMFGLGIFFIGVAIFVISLLSEEITLETIFYSLIMVLVGIQAIWFNVKKLFP